MIPNEILGRVYASVTILIMMIFFVVASVTLEGYVRDHGQCFHFYVMLNCSSLGSIIVFAFPCKSSSQRDCSTWEILIVMLLCSSLGSVVAFFVNLVHK